MKTKQLKKIFIAVLFLFLVLTQLYLLNSLSTFGNKVSKLEKDLYVLVAENDKIEESIASASSVTTLSVKAKILGLNVSPPSITLNGPIPIAFSPLAGN